MVNAPLAVKGRVGFTKSAGLAVLAVALSVSPALAQPSAVAASSAPSLVISGEAVLAVTAPSSLVPFAEAVAFESSLIERGGTPWWATTLAVAGPLADGLSTVYALRQSGPNVKVREGNAFYHHLFGSDVKAREIMAFKVAQAALVGYAVHVGGRHSVEAVVGSAIIQSAIHFFVASQNMKNAALAKRLNAGAR